MLEQANPQSLTQERLQMSDNHDSGEKPPQPCHNRVTSHVTWREDGKSWQMLMIRDCRLLKALASARVGDLTPSVLARGLREDIPAGPTAGPETPSPRVMATKCIGTWIPCKTQVS